MGDSNATDDETAAALAELLGDLPDRLRDEADAAVANARDADDLVERLSGLSERRDERDADETVAAASSVADLRAALDAAGADDGTDADAGTDGSAPVAHGDAEDDGVFGSVRSTLDGVRDRVTGGSDSDADQTSPGDGEAAPEVEVNVRDEAEADADDAESTGAGGDGVDIAVDDDDGESPVSTGIERSRELAARARSPSVPSIDRDVSLPTVDRDRTRDVVRAARDGAGAGAVELKRTVRNADPKQAAVWGLATGVTVANPAIAAGYSTAALLSGAVLGGSAVGAYASSHENTVFDDLEPMLMARRANAGASTGAGARNVNGKSVGAMLGASAYLAEELTPEAYAHWLAEADAESVLRGADMGAGRAADSPDFSGPRSGAALGAGFGLLYGLASDDDGDTEGGDDVRELLDDDLFDGDAGRLGDDAEPVEARPADGGGDETGAVGDDADSADVVEGGDVDIPDAEEHADEGGDSAFEFDDGDDRDHRDDDA